MRIESGPTMERRVRTTLLFLMFAGMGAYFAYDGLWGYEKVNFRGHLDQLPPDKRENAADARVYKSVKPEILPSVSAAIQKDSRQAEVRGALEKLVGGPPSFEESKVWYYFGPSFRISIQLGESTALRAVGEASENSASSILLQKAIALILGLASLWIGYTLYRIFATHCILDDEGLKFDGRDAIPWVTMKSLDTGRFKEKGWLDLVYEKDGRQRKLRLDEYHLAQFNDIINTICAKREFPNPLSKPAEQPSPAS